MPEDKPTEENQVDNGEKQPTGSSQYLTLENGFLIFDSGKMLKFGGGNNSVKTDYRYGFWVGSEIYNIAPFRVSSSGTPYISSILLTNHATLPTAGTVGEILRSEGTLYICTDADPITWTVVGSQS